MNDRAHEGLNDFCLPGTDFEQACYVLFDLHEETMTRYGQGIAISILQRFALFCGIARSELRRVVFGSSFPAPAVVH